ncbi:hypothetical protein GCM10010343_24520 [Streptomyces avidinii]|nr:hypothetical protein GCM10010343_24520 [Streptomyces avidinii]
MRQAVRLGRDVQPEAAVEGERGGHVGDHHAEQIESRSHGSRLGAHRAPVLNESDTGGAVSRRSAGHRYGPRPATGVLRRVTLVGTAPDPQGRPDGRARAAYPDGARSQAAA